MQSNSLVCLLLTGHRPLMGGPEGAVGLPKCSFGAPLRVSEWSRIQTMFRTGWIRHQRPHSYVGTYGGHVAPYLSLTATAGGRRARGRRPRAGIYDGQEPRSLNPAPKIQTQISSRVFRWVQGSATFQLSGACTPLVVASLFLLAPLAAALGDCALRLAPGKGKQQSERALFKFLLTSNSSTRARLLVVASLFLLAFLAAAIGDCALRLAPGKGGNKIYCYSDNYI